MEELRQMALAYHAASDAEAKDLMAEFFNAMDPTRKGYVRFEEFTEYMKLMGHERMSSEAFFNELKASETSNEHLEAVEVVTLYYIIKSGRPFCDGNCGAFIKGTYFTCLKCLDHHATCSFNVCPQCIVGRKYEHYYDHKEFMDPFSLLHSRKMERFGDQLVGLAVEPSAPSYVESFYSIANSATTNASTFVNEIRDRAQQHRIRTVQVGDRLATLVQLSLSLGNFLAAIGACTIM